jgi:hypothetical protein
MVSPFDGEISPSLSLSTCNPPSPTYIHTYFSSLLHFSRYLYLPSSFPHHLPPLLLSSPSTQYYHWDVR